MEQLQLHMISKLEGRNTENTQRDHQTLTF